MEALKGKPDPGESQKAAEQALLAMRKQLWADVGSVKTAVGLVKQQVGIRTFSTPLHYRDVRWI